MPASQRVPRVLDFLPVVQFAIARCRALPPTSTSGRAGPDEGNGGAASADPAKEILAAVGSDNFRKYLVASQVGGGASSCWLSTFERHMSADACGFANVGLETMCRRVAQFHVSRF